MSTQDALRFIHWLRNHADGDAEARQKFLTCSLDQLAEEAKRRGFDVSSESLRRAHVVDWKMRRVHLASKG